MHTAKRLASAFNSSDLSASPLHLKDIDYLIALGAIGVHQRIASSMLRVHYGLRAADYADALEEVERLVWKLDRRFSWHVKDRRSVAKASLDFVLCPVCPACLGRKYEQEPGTPLLSDRICQMCNGTGLRAIDSRYVPDVCVEIERLESVALGGVWKRTAW